MSTKLSVTFSHVLLGPGAESSPTGLAVQPGALVIRGRLSAGGRGWRLTGSARKHRRQIHVYVTARQGPDKQIVDLEDHAYELVVGGLAGGAYGIRVTHMFLNPASTSGDTPAQLVALERSISVPRPDFAPAGLVGTVFNVALALWSAVSWA